MEGKQGLSIKYHAASLVVVWVCVNEGWIFEWEHLLMFYYIWLEKTKGSEGEESFTLV